MHYINYEMDGIGRTIVRNHSVMTFIFPPEEEYIINFVRFVREFRDARIESITTDDIKCTLIYAIFQISLYDGQRTCQNI